jgi:hypothetical protein
VKLRVALGTAKLNLQIDIGLGDAIEPPAREAEFPALLDGPAPRIRVYPREVVVAEKLHAMVVHGAINSRYKDFYDVLMLATHFAFSGLSLTRAIAATFGRRQLSLPDGVPVGLTPAFYSDRERAAEWRRYLFRSALPDAPADFALVGNVLRTFLGPLWSSLEAKGAFSEARQDA